MCCFIVGLTINDDDDDDDDDCPISVSAKPDVPMPWGSIRIVCQGRSDGADIGIYTPKISPSKLLLG